MTENGAEKRWKKHLTSALDMVAGELYDWIRTVIRRGGYVDFHILQSDIIPADLKFYEEYWISQFMDLFNVRANALPATANTEVAGQVILAIKAKLVVQAETSVT